MVEHTHTFLQNFSNCKSAAPEKITAVGRLVILTLFKRAWLGGALANYRLKTQLDLGDLAEFLIFFTMCAKIIKNPILNCYSEVEGKPIQKCAAS